MVTRTARLLRQWNVVIDAMSVQTDIRVVDTPFKIHVILAFGISPGDFRQSQGTGIHVILTDIIIIKIFTPIISLNPYYMMVLPNKHQCVGYGIVIIHFFQSRTTADSYRLNLAVPLIIIQIEPVRTGRHYRIMSR